MTKTEQKKIHSKMRRLCRVALRAFAATHNLKLEHNGIAGLTAFSPSRTFYISERPHGDALHREFEPGYGSRKEWEKFFRKGVALSFVDTKAPWINPGSFFTRADNWDPTSRRESASILRCLKRDVA
jgi:hypothetical protein